MLKLVSWNIRQLAQAWRELTDSDADLALLQEACAPPKEIASRFDAGDELWRTEGAARRLWRAALVRLSSRVKLDRIAALPIAAAGERDFAVSRLGTMAAAHVEDPDTGQNYTIVSMYAAWEYARSWMYADASAHRLISDLSVLVGTKRRHRVLAAGDINILHGHGEKGDQYWANRYRTLFDRLRMVGLEFVGPQFPNGRQANPWPAELPRESLNVPTYFSRGQTPTTAKRQLDFVFASRDIAPRVKTWALNDPAAWGPSDHCRIRIEVG